MMLPSRISNTISRFLRRSDSGEILENVFSLYILQGLNYILPFVTLPYLLRVLGVEKYGIVVLVQAVIAYFNILSSYGFDISATKEISVAPSNRDRAVIYHSVLVIKLVFVTISFFIIAVLSLTLEQVKEERIAYLYGMILVVGRALFPIWYFKGIRKMKLITVVNVISKTVMTLLIFILVTSPDDYELAILANSLGFLVAGVFSICYVYIKFDMKFMVPKLEDMRAQLVEGWYIFTSRVFVNLYTTTNIIILGIFTNNAEVGRFGVIDRLLKAFSGISNPVIEGIYPNMALYFKNDKQYYISFSSKIIWLLTFTFIGLAITSFMLSDWIIYIVNGEYDEQMILYFKVICLAIVFLPFGPIFTNMLVIQNFKKDLNKIVMYSAILNAVLVFPMVYFLEGLGLALTIIVTFGFIAIAKGSFIQSKNKHLYGEISS